jgi:hypothetical protein
MKIRHLITACIWLAAPIATTGLAAEESAGQEPSERYQELIQEKGEFKQTLVAPGLDMSQYSKVYLWDATYEYRDVGPARRYRHTFSTGRKQAFGMSEADRKWFEDIVAEAFDTEFAKGKNFEIVDEIGPGTLVLRGGLFDIISKVPPEFVGRSEIYLASVGAATLALELIDANTGEVVAVVAERRNMPTMNNRTGMAMVQANKATIRGDLIRWSKDLAKRLRNEMDKAINADATAD